MFSPDTRFFVCGPLSLQGCHCCRILDALTLLMVSYPLGRLVRVGDAGLAEDVFE
jgi:hypothetical protein